MPDDQPALVTEEGPIGEPATQPETEPTPAPSGALQAIEIVCPEEDRTYTGPQVFGLFTRGDVLEVPADQAAFLIADGTARPF